jgi:cell division protein ZapA (FtsZ GTPase activity inhibitor)
MEIMVRYRKAEWLSQFVNSKRGRINLIAAGHKGEMVQVAAMFDEYLAGLESKKSDILLLKQIGAAYVALNTLAEKVKNAGGIIYE